MKYFKVSMDRQRYPNQWVLGDVLNDQGEFVNSLSFFKGEPYRGPTPTSMEIVRNGQELEFTFSTFRTPILVAELAHKIKSLARDECELFPVSVGASRDYCILNVTRRRNCVDEDRSIFTLKEPELRSKGRYSSILKLVINSESVENSDLFRIEGFSVDMVISERVKALIDQADGIMFTSVS